MHVDSILKKKYFSPFLLLSTSLFLSWNSLCSSYLKLLLARESPSLFKYSKLCIFYLASLVIYIYLQFNVPEAD